MFTGIGGQGIQMASKALAQAAAAEGRQAMLLGRYGGEMRGGQTDASVVVADRDLRSLPILPSAGSAVVMHPAYWPATRDKIRAGGLVVANADLIDDEALGRPDCRSVLVPAASIAEELDAPMSASLVLLGAYGAATGIVDVDSLVTAAAALVPPYRQQHIEANERAIRAGGAAVSLVAPAWSTSAVGEAS